MAWRSPSQNEVSFQLKIRRELLKHDLRQPTVEYERCPIGIWMKMEGNWTVVAQRRIGLISLYNTKGNSDLTKVMLGGITPPSLTLPLLLLLLFLLPLQAQPIILSLLLLLLLRLGTYAIKRTTSETYKNIRQIYENRSKTVRHPCRSTQHQRKIRESGDGESSDQPRAEW